MTTVIDRATVDKLLASVNGDTDFFAELLETYFDDAFEQIQAMRAAVASEDGERLRRSAHSLKSNSASFGAMSLSALCWELEMLGKAGTLDGAAQKVSAIAVAFQQVKAALEAIERGD